MSQRVKPCHRKVPQKAQLCCRGPGAQCLSPVSVPLLSSLLNFHRYLMEGGFFFLNCEPGEVLLLGCLGVLEIFRVTGREHSL